MKSLAWISGGAVAAIDNRLLGRATMPDYRKIAVLESFLREGYRSRDEDGCLYEGNISLNLIIHEAFREEYPSVETSGEVAEKTRELSDRLGAIMWLSKEEVGELRIVCTKIFQASMKRED